MLGTMEGALFDVLPEHVSPKRTDGGLPRLRTAECRQVELRAVSLDDWVSADHRVRPVCDFVEGLDLSAPYARIKAADDHPGICRPTRAS